MGFDWEGPLNTSILLLRGVMPTGKNKVPMAQLRELLEKAKFNQVRTYIQSGNIVLKTSLKKIELENTVHHLIKKNIGADLVVIAKSGQQLKNIIKANPLKAKNASRIFYTIFKEKPRSAKIKDLMAQGFSSKELAINNQAAYMYIPGNAARSKLNNNFLERKLEISATTRNLNTMEKLVLMSKEDHE